MIFQDHKLIPTKTVAENIQYALEICGYSRNIIEIRTIQLLAQVGMESRAHTFVEKLSGGEAQRIAIARALIHEPVLILADEPTASLDQKNTKLIINILQKLHTTGTTIVFATHDHTLYPLVPDARIIDVEQWHVG
jgi:cell division transport system ATP-binding protein